MMKAPHCFILSRLLHLRVEKEPKDTRLPLKLMEFLGESVGITCKGESSPLRENFINETFLQRMFISCYPEL